MFVKKFSLVLPFVIAITACEPIGTSGGTINGWPREDQNLSSQNLVEIERNLRRLGIFRGRVDGQITRITRNAIARYQRSIGAPQTATVSARLVRSLRSSVANIQPARTTTRTTTQRRPATTTTTPKPAAPVKPSFSEGEDSGGAGGGGGGDDGGSWG